jgi:hypothetical protein
MEDSLSRRDTMKTELLHRLYAIFEDRYARWQEEWIQELSVPWGVILELAPQKSKSWVALCGSIGASVHRGGGRPPRGPLPPTCENGLVAIPDPDSPYQDYINMTEETAWRISLGEIP